MMPLTTQVAWLFLLAIPIACVAWTVTHEEIFKEPREFCVQCSKKSQSLLVRKFFYLFTCEYCFSHYVTIGALFLTGFKFLLDDWRGYLLAAFALVWIANVYMSLMALIKVDIRKERLEIQSKEEELK